MSGTSIEFKFLPSNLWIFLIFFFLARVENTGKAESTWDRLVHEHPDRIYNGDTGDVAANSYYHYKEDVAILKNLGVNVFGVLFFLFAFHRQFNLDLLKLIS